MKINHNLYSNLAFHLAVKNLGKTKTNPSVGCIVVKNESVISSATTSINGRPHAEFKALNKNIDFKNFDKISQELTSLAINEALKLIKSNLKSLGINHDNFVSEKKLVENQEVEKVVEFLQKTYLFIKEK